MFKYNELFGTILLTTILLTAKAQSGSIIAARELNVTSPIEDYISENARQNLANIVAYEEIIEKFKLNFINQFNAVDIESNLLEEKVIQNENELNPLVLLNNRYKYCVQKYRKEIPSITTVKTNLLNCVRSERNAALNLATSLENTKNTLRNYYNNNLQTLLKNCITKNPISQLNYTLCVLEAISGSNTYTANNRKYFNTQLEIAKCDANRRVRSGVECSFTTLFDFISAIGSQKRLIENCISGAEFEQIDGSNTSCDDVLDVPLFAFNATISNSHITINNNATCLLINFI